MGRLIPLVRSFIGLVSGFMEVPVLQFEIFNVIGTVIWATALTLIGYALGGDWTRAAKNFSHASDALAALVILALVALIAHKGLQIRKEHRAEAAAAANLAASADRTGPDDGSAASGEPAERIGAAQSDPAAFGASGQGTGETAAARPHSHRRPSGRS